MEIRMLAKRRAPPKVNSSALESSVDQAVPMTPKSREKVCPPKKRLSNMNSRRTLLTATTKTRTRFLRASNKTTMAAECSVKGTLKMLIPRNSRVSSWISPEVPMTVMKASRKRNTPREKRRDAKKINVKTLLILSNWMAAELRNWLPRKKNMARMVRSWKTSTPSPTNCHWETFARLPGSGITLPIR